MATIRMKCGDKYADVFDSEETIRIVKATAKKATGENSVSEKTDKQNIVQTEKPTKKKK